MDQYHHQRIDKGQKRLKTSVVENEARQQARDNAGKFLPVASLETRSQAILEAVEGLRLGAPTPIEVARKHQIPQSTLYSWLIADPRASEARSTWFGERLGTHLDRIETAKDPLELARAREAYRAWADIASKRDPGNYGVKQEVTHTIKPEFTVILKPQEGRLIEGQTVDGTVDKQV